jgi:sortase A
VKRTTLTRCLLLIVAVSCLGFYAYTFLERMGSQFYAARSFERDSKRPPPLPVKVTRTGPLPRDSIVGRLSIPKLHLSAMVREGADAKTLKLAVGHIPSTSLPGQPGNVGVAGHRDTFFRHLGDLKTGDSIAFLTVDGDFTYEVESSKVVEPEDVGVLTSTREKVLTMVTCYPFYYIGNAPKRFIVRAKQIAGTEK